MPTEYISFYLINPTLVSGGVTALAAVLKYEVDMTVCYNLSTDANPDRTKSSDQMTELLYHEITHAAHYNKVGGSWWATVYNAELQEIAGNLQNPELRPYGNGTSTSTAPVIALAESWAYHIGHFMADLKYPNNRSGYFEQGITYWNGSLVDGGVTVVTNLNTHVNLLEDFSPSRAVDPFRWIPQGLYYDLMDDRNDNIQVPRRILLDDQVKGYNNRQFFDALDNDINSLPNYRARLLAESGNNQSTGVTAIFNFYGY